MKFKNALLYGEDFQFHKGELCVQGETISTESTDGIEVEAESLFAIPGLIDLHIHGAYGHDFCEGTDQALDAMCEYLGKNGITAFAATSMSLPENLLASIYENAAHYQQKKGALFVAINMEGPFLAPEKKAHKIPGI